MSATIERDFHQGIRAGRRGGWRRRVEVGPSVDMPVAVPERVHPLARRMALAITSLRLIQDRAVADAASLAGVAGVTRARMTQLLNFTLLAPDIQAALLDLPAEAAISERDLRPIMAMQAWKRQRVAWGRVAGVRRPPA